MHENRANTTKHPNRAPTVAPVLVLARLLEVEPAVVFEGEPESLSVTEVRLAELGVVVKGLVVETEGLVELDAGIVSLWPKIINVCKKYYNTTYN